MTSEPLIFFLIISVTAVLAGAVAWLTRNITFYGAVTDNHTQVLTAASAGTWRFPSDMHKVVDNGVRTRMKDGHVLGLVLVQRLLKDKQSDYPTIVLCLAVNFFSAVLIYLIAENYWNTYVALVIWGLWVSSLWPYQVAVFGTHICTSNMFCLVSIFMIQNMATYDTWAEYLWAAGAGATFALCLFSSGSSRKYIPLIIAAFLFTQREYLSLPELNLSITQIWANDFSVMVAGLSGVLLIITLVARFMYKPMVSAAYDGRSLPAINKIFKSRELRDKQYYLSEIKERLNTLTWFLVIAALYLFVSTIVSTSSNFFILQLFITIGAVLTVSILTFPNVSSNLYAYYIHSRGWKLNRFLDYAEFFQSRGAPLRKGMRGGGARWLILFAFRIIPLTFSIYVMSFAILAALLISGGSESISAIQLGLLVLVSISPALVGELTKGVQSGRYYFPGFVSLFLIVGCACFSIQNMIEPVWQWLLWAITAGTVLCNALITSIVFLSDVLPARMAPAALTKIIQDMNIGEIYTFDTKYNDALVGALPPDLLSRLQINYISSINEVASGYIVIPGTSSKALNMESESQIVRQGDFNEDEELEQLISSRNIRKYAIAALKTFGTSRIWHQEAEITTYRDLILKDVQEEDRWRGKAWVLDGDKLNDRRNLGCSL